MSAPNEPRILRSEPWFVLRRPDGFTRAAGRRAHVERYRQPGDVLHSGVRDMVEFPNGIVIERFQEVAQEKPQ